jgi:hypothetical protein
VDYDSFTFTFRDDIPMKFVTKEQYKEPNVEPHFILYYETDSIWMAIDMNGNTVNALAPAVIYNFDCPALNENPEFIEWVFANAKVYPNFESPNEIKSFTSENQMFPPGEDVVTSADNLKDAFWSGMQEVNRTGTYFEFDVDGQFTATFSVNGESVTKTFTNVNVLGDSNMGLPVFSNGADNLVFLSTIKTEGGIMDENGDLCSSSMKYNGIYVDGEIEFTKFDCMLNTKTKDILSFILCYTAVGVEYHNGYGFKDYAVDKEKEYDGTVEVK